MKPKNFPARKNARRIAALSRLRVLAPEQRDRVDRETLTLHERIVHPATALGVRTKKDRSDRASFRRA